MRDEGDVKDNESEEGMGEEGTKGEGWKGIKTWRVGEKEEGKWRTLYILGLRKERKEKKVEQRKVHGET